MEWRVQAGKWLESWDESGYLVVENAVGGETLGRLREGLVQIQQSVTDDSLSGYLRGHISLERDRTRGLKSGEVDSDTISNIMELPLFGTAFRDFIWYPRILDILEVLFGSSEFTFHNYKCICKMPGNKAQFAWHRDLPYLEHTTANLITCMVCVDDMTVENGATVVCPGSHKVGDAAVTWADTDMDEKDVPANRVPVICPAGSAVLFHVNIIHGGGPNVSDKPRRNVIGIWAGPDALPTTPARYAYEFVAPRSRDAMRRRQIEMTFADAGRRDSN